MDILKTEKIKLSISGVNDYADIDANSEELKMFEYIKSVCPSVQIARKTEAYLTACLGDTDVARFKFSPRAKWIVFPYLENKSKRYIEKIADLRVFDDDIIKSYAEAEKIENYGK